MAAWVPALAAGRTALAHQLVAGAYAQLMLATEYAQDRRQFGVPIASFQAIKHRLADTLVAISAADAATLAAGATGTEWGAAVAKALAGRAAAAAARNCLQVFGGIGFTEEHEFQRRFRRNLVLERLLGDGRRWSGSWARTCGQARSTPNMSSSWKRCRVSGPSTSVR